MRIRSILPIVVACSVVLGTASFAQSGERSTTIALDSTTIDVLQPAPKVTSELSVAASRAVTRDGAAAEDYVLVKFPGPVRAAQRRALEMSVERVYAYLPYDTFLVKRRHDVPVRKAGAIWTGAYEPAYKLSPSVKAAAGFHDGRPAIVMVHVYPDAPLDEVVAEIERLDLGEVVGAQEKARFSRIRLLVDPAHAAAAGEELAKIAEVFSVAAEPRRTLLNDTTVWVAQSGTDGGQATPVHDQGILGQGQIVGVLDTGIDADMCYFRDGTLGLPPTNACNGGTTVDLNQRKVVAVDFLWSSECSGGISSSEWDTHDHGTHVAGTIAGDDLANPLVHDPGDGLAPGAKLVVQDCGYQTNNCADCPGIGCPVVDLNPVFQQPYDQGARIHSNSWGDDENNPNGGLYSSGSQDADEFMWNHKDFTLVFANGNSGPGSVTVLSPATGKNVVSVGATLRGTSAESMASFSSCGPTADGRIKPDVTMPGSSIVSANNDLSIGTNNCGTRTMSGTSMAAPGAAGALALVREYFMDGFYPSGAASAPDAFTPTAALLKATLINSARDMTNVAAIPSNCQGWGRVTLGDALYFTGGSRDLWVEDDTTGFAQGSSGETRSFNFSVPTTSGPFKATLTWTDYPAAPGANPTIVNDLDLEVTGPGGTYLGNVFSGGESTTGGSADRLDTVEQVLIKTPAAGSYTVTVRSFTVPNGPQPFALAVTGDLNGCSPAPIANAGTDRTIDEGQSTTIGTPAQPGHTYSWSPGGATTAEVTVSPASTTTYTVTATTSCGSAQDAVTVTVQPAGQNGPQDAVYDSGLGAPQCAVAGSECDSLALLDGRANLGPEPNQPNTLGTCTDGSSGTYHSDESNDQIVVKTLDGLDMAEGATVRVDATVYAWSTGSSDHLDLWYAADANSPSWQLITTINLSSGGLQTLSAQYTLPAGGLQAVRAVFRYNGSQSTCSAGSYDDADDLVFAVKPAGGGCTVDADCDDGLYCNGTETCNAGACQAGTAVSCDDGVACTDDVCNETTDSCDATANDANCDNGLFCDGAEVCNVTLGCQDGPDPCSGSQTCNETTDVCEGGGGCTHGADFESGAGGWTNGADTCTTGAFVVGTPDATTWQAGGGNPGQAFFTQPNPGGLGTDDVDGGTCEALSPIVDCSGQAAAAVSLDYFHGQRDAGGDPGDGFTIEVLNDGAVVDTVVSIGDVTSNPVWTHVSTVVSNPGNLQVRVRATDATASGDIVEAGIDNVSITATTPPSCVVDDDFESGTTGWDNDPASTCSTGDYVAGNPTNPSGGYQVVGSHSGSTSIFTGVNTSAGADDVDGGNCILSSPSWSVPNASTLSVWYWHGQRDAGDDPSGDFFRLEYSTNGGSTWSTLATNGDATSNPAWTNATAQVPAGSTVELRVQCSDGTAAGDLVECGIDDVSICE